MLTEPSKGQVALGLGGQSRFRLGSPCGKHHVASEVVTMPPAFAVEQVQTSADQGEIRIRGSLRFAEAAPLWTELRRLGPEGRCLGEPQAAADADLALIGAGLHLLDCECRRHRDDLARDMMLPAWRAESETRLTSKPEGDLALARFSKHGPCHGRRRWKSAHCLSGHPAGERQKSVRDRPASVRVDFYPTPARR